MIQVFQRHYREALGQRRQVAATNLKKPLVFLAIGTVAFLALAVVMAPPDKPSSYYFYKDGYMVTYLSAGFLGLASIFSGVCFNLSRTRTDFLRFFWLVAAAGFAFLFLDELFEFHEMADRWLATVSVPEGFRHWNDIAVILYGVVAFLIMAGFLPELFRYPRVVEMMGMAFLFYFIHTLVDSTQEPRTDLSAIIEESAKVFCAEYLAISMFVASLGMKAAAKLLREK